MEGGAGEEVGELQPDFAGEGGFGACAEEEEPNWGRVRPEAFDVYAGACAGWVEGVAEGWRVGVSWGGRGVEGLEGSGLPLRLRRPSGVRPSFRPYGESSWRTLPIVMG